jgi:hypothetical protein
LSGLENAWRQAPGHKGSPNNSMQRTDDENGRCGSSVITPTGILTIRWELKSAAVPAPDELKNRIDRRLRLVLSRFGSARRAAGVLASDPPPPKTRLRVSNTCSARDSLSSVRFAIGVRSLLRPCPDDVHVS